MLTDFAAKLKGSTLTPAQQAALLSPVERKLDNFRVMKHTTDVYAGEARDKRLARDKTIGAQLALQQKREDIKKKLTEVTELIGKKKYKEANELALQIKSLDPEDPALTAVYEMTKRQMRLDHVQSQKAMNEELTFKGLNAVQDLGPSMDDNQPLKVDPVAALKARLRQDNTLNSKPMSVVEREIEVKLERPLTVEYTNTSLKQVIASLAETTKINITTDDAALAEAGIKPESVLVTENLRDLSLKNVLNILLDKARLKYVVENDVVRVTTEKRAAGRLFTKVFQVMELVTPVPDFALAPHQNLGKCFARSEGGAGVAGDGQRRQRVQLQRWAGQRPIGVGPDAG